jgi:hypothetical protein
MQDRRKEQRGPAFIGGRASFLNGQTTASVLIRNSSASGARLVVDNGHFVPNQFDLAVPQWQTEMRAVARWRHNDQIGVEFERLDQGDMTIPLSMERVLNELKAKNRKLKRRVAELSQ